MTIKSFFKWLILLLASFLCVGLAYLGFYTWKQGRFYEEELTITAYYMRYACGDCILDMKVQAVDNPTYNFILGKDILPKPENLPVENLCDFIQSKSYSSSSGPDFVAEHFVLKGYLHKHSHGLPFLECSEAPFFTVRKIKYGTKGKWIAF